MTTQSATEYFTFLLYALAGVLVLSALVGVACLVLDRRDRHRDR